jgi:ketosteroid isomerase-like protein
VESDGALPEPAIKAPDMNAFWATHVAHRQRGDLDAATSILAEDCVLFEPFRPPVKGLENIALKMKEAFAMAEIHDVSF